MASASHNKGAFPPPPVETRMNLAPALAAPGDTWGISGPTFMYAYLTAAVVIFGVSLVLRSQMRIRRSSADVDRLTPVQVALLNGGEKLAVYAAIGELRTGGAIGVDPSHRLVATGSPPAAASELARAVHAAVAVPGRAKDLRRDVRVRGALDDLHRGLARTGLAVNPAQHRVARLMVRMLLVLIGIGILRLIAGLINGRPVGFLVMALVASLVVWLLLRRVPYETRAGASAMTALRRRHAHLSPRNSPAYTAYGVAGAAMGVALFGTASLWAMDPAFAGESEIRRQAVIGGTDGSGGYSAGGSGCGSGDSDGGGGCGGGGCGG